MRRLLWLLPVLVAACGRAPEDPNVPLQSIRVDDLRRHQSYLASGELEGRKAGSDGGRKAAAYLESECKRLGLKPAGKDGGYFFPFTDAGREMKNVIARWSGSDESGEWVAIAAHYDHLGLKDGEMHLGADDNGSGTSVLLEIAEAATKAKFRRSIVFFWFDGEELGLLGSKAWVADPTLKIDSCAVMLNVDMVGRNDPKQLIICLEKDKVRKEPLYPLWAAAIREAEGPSGMSFDWSSADYLIERSDNWSFMQKGVPAAFFTGGLHADYHKPTDTVDRIDFGKEERVGRTLYSIVARCANYPGRFR
jgi:Zn-dependent M28 family amino/carboxypeptidase